MCRPTPQARRYSFKKGRYEKVECNSDDIADHVKQFLKKGGAIEKVESSLDHLFDDPKIRMGESSGIQ